MQTVLRLANRFASLSAQYNLNKSRNAVRFETQNLLWDFEESNYHTLAFSKGLLSLNFQKGTYSFIQVTTSYFECLPANRPKPTLLS